MKNSFILPISAGFLFLIIGAVSTINVQASESSSGLFISEISYAGSTVSGSDKWVEISNTSDKAVNLRDWDIVIGKKQADTIIKNDFVIPAKGFGVIKNRNSNFQSILETQELNKHELGNLNFISGNTNGEKYLQVGLINPQGQETDFKRINDIDWREQNSSLEFNSNNKRSLEFTSNGVSGEFATNEFSPGNFGTPGFAAVAIVPDSSPVIVAPVLETVEVVSPATSPVIPVKQIQQSLEISTNVEVVDEVQPARQTQITAVPVELAISVTQTALIDKTSVIPSTQPIVSVIQDGVVSPVSINSDQIIQVNELESLEQADILDEQSLLITALNLVEVTQPITQATAEVSIKPELSVLNPTNLVAEIQNPGLIGQETVESSLQREESTMTESQSQQEPIRIDQSQLELSGSGNIVANVVVQNVLDTSGNQVIVSRDMAPPQADLELPNFDSLPNSSLVYTQWIEALIEEEFNKNTMIQNINIPNSEQAITSSSVDLNNDYRIASLNNNAQLVSNSYEYLNQDYQNTWLNQILQKETEWKNNLASIIAANFVYLIFLVVRLLRNYQFKIQSYV